MAKLIERSLSRTQEREESRVERLGRRLAQQAVKAASKGRLSEDIPEGSFPFRGTSLREDYPEASYDVARGLLAEEGLTVNRVVKATDPLERGSRAGPTATYMKVEPLEPQVPVSG